MEKTFSAQAELPRLPVAGLAETLEGYVRSVRPFVSAEEAGRTEAAAREFLSGDGPRLQALLERRVAVLPNWLERWWEEEAYLRLRVPLVPFCNFGGSSHNWERQPPEDGAQTARAALSLHNTARYWLAIRRQTVPLMRSRGHTWCMHQTYRMFNSYRRPGREMDSIRLHFRTEDEGDCPSHIVVLCRGHLWRLALLDAQGEAASPSEFQDALEEILRLSAEPNPDFVGSLTCADRSVWAAERQRLVELSPENEAALLAVEEAAFLMTLTEERPESEADVARLAVAAPPRLMWADKCLNYMVHANGILSNCSEHAIVDAVVNVQMCAQTDADLAGQNFRFLRQPVPAQRRLAPQPLRFRLDDGVRSAIRAAEETMRANSAALDISVDHFDGYGTALLKPLKVYGDTVVQLAAQVAHVRLHGEPAPAYETGSTRKFFHGRTETVRSGTAESVALARAVAQGEPEERQRALLGQAIRRHDHLMAEATEGRGVDRHLMGLRLLAREQGLAEPRLFTDKAWTASGGDGNFRLSTSFIGYTGVWGGVAPMCSQGYGLFYKMTGKRMTLLTSAWLGPEERTDRKAFQEAVFAALHHIRHLLQEASANTQAKL